MVFAKSGTDVSFVLSQWDEGISRWRFNLPGGSYRGKWQMSATLWKGYGGLSYAPTADQASCAEQDKVEAAKTDIGWGHQIRSYVLHPYQMVKDLRTGVEKGNAQGVLDGDIGDFMNASLAARFEPGGGQNKVVRDEA